MTTRAPSASRDIQKRTGWNYQYALAVVRAIGYEAVSKAIDDLGESPTAAQLTELRTTLKETLHAR